MRKVSGGHDRYGQNGEHRGRRKNDQKAQSRNAEPDVEQLPMEKSSRHDEFEKNYDKVVVSFTKSKIFSWRNQAFATSLLFLLLTFHFNLTYIYSCETSESTVILNTIHTYYVF